MRMVSVLLSEMARLSAPKTWTEISIIRNDPRGDLGTMHRFVSIPQIACPAHVPAPMSIPGALGAVVEFDIQRLQYN